MITLIHDPIGLGESAVIAACLVFYAWWFSPRQRQKRRREQARDRMQLRRAFVEPIERPEVRVRVPSLPRSQGGAK